MVNERHNFILKYGVEGAQEVTRINEAVARSIRAVQEEARKLQGGSLEASPKAPTTPPASPQATAQRELTEQLRDQGPARPPLGPEAERLNAAQGRLVSFFDQVPRDLPFSMLQARVADLGVALGRAKDAYIELARAEKENGVGSEEYVAAQRVAARAFSALQGAIQREVKARNDIVVASEKVAAREAAESRLRQQYGDALAREFIANPESKKAYDSLERQRQAAYARQTQAQTQALSQADIDRVLTRPLRQPDDTDRIYRAREVLADRRLQAEAAELNLHGVVNKALLGEAGTRDQAAARIRTAQTSYDAANRAVVDAENRLANALRDAEVVQRRTAAESFAAGFRGRSQIPLMEQFGQAAKFSIFYGTAYKLLFAFTQTLRQSLQEGVDFQQALTDLVIATGETREKIEDLGDQLGQQSTQYGFAPGQGAQVAARSIGLYGATEASFDEQKRIGLLSNALISRLAFSAPGQDPVTLQQNIAAITQALGYGPEGQIRVGDLDAYLTKKFGAGTGSTFEAVAQSASVGKAAGFSDEELFSMAALLISRTGQSSTAVGGYLAQIFSRGGEGTLTSVAQRYGIDANQDLRSIFAQLAQQYQNADPARQAEIATAFGRGKVQNAVVAALQDFPELIKEAGNASRESAGSLQKLADLRLGDIGGQLTQLGGAVKEFYSLFGEAGFLDVVGLGVVVFRELLEAVNSVLRLYRDTTGPLGGVIAGLAALSLTLKFMGGTEVSRLATLGGLVPLRAQAAFSTSLANSSALAATRGRVFGTSFGAVGRAGGYVRAGGAAIASLIGPAGLAVGGLLAIAAVKGSMDRLKAAEEETSAALTSFRPDDTPQSFYNQANYLEDVANRDRQAVGGFTKFITFGLADNGIQARADEVDREAARLREAGQILERQQASAPTDTSAIRSLVSADVASGLDQLEAAGAAAGERLASLREVLYGTARAAGDASDVFNASDFSKVQAPGIQSALFNTFDDFNFDDYFKDATYFSGESELRSAFTPDVLRDRLRNGLGDVQANLQAALKDAGVGSLKDLDPQTLSRLADSLVPENGQLMDQVLEGVSLPDDVSTEQDYAQYRTRLTNVLRNGLVRYLESQFEQFDESFKLSAVDAAALVSRTVELSDGQLDRLPTNAYGEREAELQARLRDLRRISRRTQGGATGANLEAIADARRDLVQAGVDEMEGLRAVALHNARTRAQAVAASRSLVTREITRVVQRGGTSDQLAEIIERSGQYTVDVARGEILSALAVARASLRSAQRQKRAAQAAKAAQDQARTSALQSIISGTNASLGALGTLSSALSSISAATGASVGSLAGVASRLPGASRKARQAQSEIQRLNQLLDSLKTTAPGGIDTELSGFDDGNDSGSGGKGGGGGGAEKDSAAQIRAARIAAMAARRGGDIASARAAIAQARADLSDAKKGTVEYYNALASLYQAQDQLTDALQAYRANLRLLRRDQTNPLQVARAEAAAAAEKLRSDIRRGKARDVIAQDRVDLRNAQANAEQTAFQQRLDAVRTADDLGRISHQKYLSYLEHERDRLESIKHRTFQQQQQLDEVDRLLKEAKQSAAGQFNFGDIKLPTPYQVRRYMTAQLRQQQGAASAAAPVVNNVVNMQVDGADTAKVKQIVKDVVGAGARITTTSTRKR